MRSADWRSPDEYKEALQFDAPEFAWEFLRRNADYHKDHASLRHLADNGRGTPEELNGFALRWGTRFCEKYRERAGVDAERFAERRLPHRIGLKVRQSRRSIVPQSRAHALGVFVGRSCLPRFRSRAAVAHHSLRDRNLWLSFAARPAPKLSCRRRAQRPALARWRGARAAPDDASAPAKTPHIGTSCSRRPPCQSQLS